MGCGDARALKTGISRRSGASLEGFLDFEATDYSPEATETFLRLLDDEDYINEIRAYSVFDGGALVGMLATRWGGNHITIFRGRQISQARHRKGAVRAGRQG